MGKPSYKTKLKDIAVIITLTLIAAIATIFLNINFLTSTLLFYGPASAYLIWRKPSNFKKVSLAALIFGVIWGFSFNYIAEFNNAWNWGTGSGLLFPMKIFGVMSVDVMVWYFLWIFLIIAFYEYFIEFDASRKISKRALPIALTGVGLAIFIVVVSKLFPHLLLFEYTYLWLGGATLIPFIYVIFRAPTLLSKTLSVIPFFFFLYLTSELVSLQAQLWSFPGQYIGTIQIQNITFPIEEFLFWVLISSAVTVAYYEHAIDDRK